MVLGNVYIIGEKTRLETPLELSAEHQNLTSQDYSVVRKQHLLFGPGCLVLPRMRNDLFGNHVKTAGRLLRVRGKGNVKADILVRLYCLLGVPRQSPTGTW